MATDVITSSLDLRRMVQEAEAAGFNPLSVLRNGGAAGFATQTTTYEPGVGSGQFTSEPPASPVAPPPAPAVSAGAGVQFFPEHDLIYSEKSGWGSLSGSSVSNERPGPWELESELNIAIHQLRQRTGALVTDDGKFVPTRGSLFEPVSYTAPAGGVRSGQPSAAIKPADPVKDKSGKYQQSQVYQPDKISSVITESTFHPWLPGIEWEEVGGVTRGENGEIIYGDESPANVLFSWPKGLNDIGHNANRVYDAIGGPRWFQDVQPHIDTWFSEGAARVTSPIPPQEPVDWGR